MLLLPPNRIRVETILLFLIILAGAVLRFYGINFGAPFKYHPDEVKLLTQAGYLLNTHFMSRDAYFAFGIYPLLYTMLLAVLMGVFIVFNLLTGRFESLEYARVYYETNSFTFLLIGRYFVAVLGIISIYVLYKILKELYNERIALSGSALLAVNFVHVRNSHFSTVDIPATFFALFAIYYAAKIIKNPRMPYYFGAGLFIAAATAAKYSLFLIALPFLWAHLSHVLHNKKYFRLFFNKKLFLSAFTGLVAFLLFCPLFIIDTNRTFHGLNRIHTFEKVGKIGSGGGIFSYWTGDQAASFGMFYPNSIPSTFGIVLTLFVLIGIGIQIKRHSKGDVLLLLFTIPTYLFFEDMSYKAMRHILPIIPLLTASGAVAIVWFCNKVFKKAMLRDAALGGIILGMIVSGAFSTVNYFNYLSQPDPRTKALTWVSEHIAPGTKIAVESFPPYLPGLFNQDSLQTGDYRIVQMNLNNKIDDLADSLITSFSRDSIQYYIADGFTRHFFEWKYTNIKYPKIVTDRKKLFRWLEVNTTKIVDFEPENIYIQPFVIIYKIKDN